jgi:nucleoside-diphosphate-sugar epimerase
VKVLVLGGTRFIGRRLVERLLAAGHRVTLLNRGRKLDPFGSRVSRVKGDRRNPEDLARAAHGGRDAIFDLLCYDAAGAAMAVEAFAGRTGRYIFISTGSVYWSTGQFSCPVKEEEFHEFGEFEERPSSIEYDYGYGKRQAEEIFFAAHREGKLPVTICRLPIVGGETDPSLRYISYFYRIDDGRPLILPDAGAACFRHVYVDDVASLLPTLPERPEAAGRAYNLASEEVVDLGAVVRLAARFLDRPVATVPVPMEVLDARGLDREFSPFSQPASQVPCIARARKELAWKPTPYEEWLEKVAVWYREYYRAGAPPHYAHREKELAVMEAYLKDLDLPAPRSG